MRWVVAWLIGCLCIASASAGETINVTVDGVVDRQGSAAYPSESRLSTVASAARVQPEAYLLGAAWLRPALERDQLRLRAGVVYELAAIRRGAIVADDDALARSAATFQAWFAALPVTGRRTGVSLDPTRLDVTSADDWPVAEGDRLFYPRRPRDIRVVGAVRQSCTVPQVPMQDARRYLAACPVSPAADPDMIYVVQPDGVVFRQNVALWNRDPPRPVAPGAWIYVPFDRKAIAEATDGQFNQDVADFLATQLLDGEDAR